MRSARVQLSFCSIVSPIDGRTGSLLVHEGNIVKANETVLVTINQLTPAYVSFRRARAVPAADSQGRWPRARCGSMPAFAATISASRWWGNLSFIDNLGR